MITEKMNLQGSYPKGNQPQVLYAGSRGRGRFGRGQQGREEVEEGLMTFNIIIERKVKIKIIEEN